VGNGHGPQPTPSAIKASFLLVHVPMKCMRLALRGVCE